MTANYVAETLKAAGFDTRATDSQTEALALYQEHKADLVLTNHHLGSGTGTALLKALRKMDPDFLGVMTTGIGNEDVAREAILSGALDYVIKNGYYYQKLPSMVLDFIVRHKTRKSSRFDLEQKHRLEAQAELAVWFDHNFKNILSALTGSLNLIDFDNDGQSSEKRKEYVRDGLDCVKTAMKLLDSLSALSRSGDAFETPSPVSVAVLADEAFLEVKRTIEGNSDENVTLGRVLERLRFENYLSRLPILKVVSGDLRTIFSVLIKNAVESMSSKQTNPIVTLKGEMVGPHLCCVVEDNGKGMDETVAKHAFEPLYSTKGLVGVGMSLAMVRSLVLKHLGEVGCESEPGKGSIFRFTYLTED
jgi:signal transduction histidine kinase